MEAKPRPLLGGFLGFLIGLVVVVIVWQLGVTPPDRLAVFGIVSLMMFIVTLLLTQSIAIVKVKFIVVMVIASVLGAAALTGIPAAFGSGSLSEGCYADGTSSLDFKTPDGTSASDPFDITRDDTVEWYGETDNVLKNWNSALGVRVAGFDVPIWRGESENADEDQMWDGEEDVAPYLEDIEGATGVDVAGTFVVFGYINAAEGGNCTMVGYVRLESEGAFAGPLMIGLWVVLVVLIIIVIVMAVVVKKSIAAAAVAGAAGASGDAAAAASIAEGASDAVDEWVEQRRTDRAREEFRSQDGNARAEALREELEKSGDEPPTIQQQLDSRKLGDLFETDGGIPPVPLDEPDESDSDSDSDDTKS